MHIKPIIIAMILWTDMVCTSIAFRRYFDAVHIYKGRMQIEIFEYGINSECDWYDRHFLCLIFNGLLAKIILYQCVIPIQFSMHGVEVILDNIEFSNVAYQKINETELVVLIQNHFFYYPINN